MMDTDDSVDILKNLLQLNVNIVEEAYDPIIEKITDTKQLSILNSLRTFRSDHEKNIQELEEALKRLGVEKVREEPDFKGILIRGFTEVRSITGIEGMLKAMALNEEFSKNTYKKLLDSENNIPTNCKDIVSRQYRMEENHLSYIQILLKDKPWEASGSAVKQN